MPSWNECPDAPIWDNEWNGIPRVMDKIPLPLPRKHWNVWPTLVHCPSIFHLVDAFETRNKQTNSDDDDDDVLTLRRLCHNESHNKMEERFRDLYQADHVTSCQWQEIIVNEATPTMVSN